MESLIKWILIAAVILVGYYFPKSYNNYYFSRYQDNGVSWLLAVVSVIILVIAVIIGQDGGLLFGILMTLFVLSVIGSLAYCWISATKLGATVFDKVVLMLAQLSATFGIVAFLIIAIAALNSLDNHKKKRK